MRDKYKAIIYFARLEPVSFAHHEVVYRVHGTVTSARHYARYGLEEGAEAEIIDVWRYDPFNDNTETPVKPSEWPFSDDELQSISNRLLSEAP